MQRSFWTTHIDSIYVEGMEPSHENITKMGCGIDKRRLRHIFACRFIFHFKYKQISLVAMHRITHMYHRQSSEVQNKVTVLGSSYCCQPEEICTHIDGEVIRLWYDNTRLLKGLNLNNSQASCATFWPPCVQLILCGIGYSILYQDNSINKIASSITP